MNEREIEYALAKQVPDMKRGFTIGTSYGDIVIEAGWIADLITDQIRNALKIELRDRVGVAPLQAVEAQQISNALFAKGQHLISPALAMHFDAQYLAAGLGGLVRPISYDPELVRKPAAAHRPDASSGAVQVPGHTDELAIQLRDAAASLANTAHQLALCAAALHQIQTGSVQAPQSDPEGLL